MLPTTTKPRVRLTGADYMTLTPPSHRGRRYQLIEGELIEMAGPNHPHQVFTGRLYIQLTLQTDQLGIGEVHISPYDVAIDEHNTFQPDLLFVSHARRHIFDGHGVTDAPDVVVEVLSESTRQRDLAVKLPRLCPQRRPGNVGCRPARPHRRQIHRRRADANAGAGVRGR